MVSITDEYIGVSQLLGPRARAASPQVYASGSQTHLSSIQHLKPESFTRSHQNS